MQNQERSALRNILATNVPEGAAQTGLSLFIAALQSLVADLRAIRETLEEPDDAAAAPEDAVPDSLAHFLRATIEGVLVDHIQPAIRILSRAAAATLEDLNGEGKERQAV